MNSQKIIRSVTIFVILLLIPVQSQPFVASLTTPHGARSDLSFSPYLNLDSAYASLKAGEIDLLGWPLTAELYQDAVADPDIQLAATTDLGTFEFDFNNNYTIAKYAGIRSPMSYVNFRRALAHLVDKDGLVNETLGGLAERIDVPIPGALKGWWNKNVTGPNYPYPPDPYEAAALLDADGFLEGSTPNPYYDPTVPWSAEYIRTYPPDHPQKPEQDLDPISFYARSDRPERLAAGVALRDTMRKIGIPVQWEPATSSQSYQKVFIEKDYHIYTGAWRVNRFPPRYMYPMFHSMFWSTQNIVTGMNASGLPNYPDLDKALEKAYYARNYSDAIFYSNKVQSLLVAKYCVSVWLWSPLSWYAYRNLLGVVNMEGRGISNKYTYINAFRVDNSSAPVRVAIPTPNALNIIYSRWQSDWQVLNALYTHLMNNPPYDLSKDQPWVAQDWEVGTWIDPIGVSPEQKTNVTFWIRKDTGIAAPVTGNFMRNYTANDVAFTIWYHYAFNDSWNWHTVSDMHHTRIVDDYTIEVYFDKYSYWLLYGVATEMPLLPRNELISQLCYLGNRTFSLPAVSPSTEYQFTDQQVIDMVSLSRDFTILVEGVDYEIVVNSTEHRRNVIHFLRSQPSGTYYATYYTPRWKPTGYYLGSDYGLNWTDTMYSLAPHYPKTSPLDLKANNYFFLETPPLGEIDFVVKPNGAYKIDIFDVVLVAGAYGSTGNGIPDPNWLPGADLAPPECLINIFDVITVTGKYGKEFGHPPSDP